MTNLRHPHPARREYLSFGICHLSFRASGEDVSAKQRRLGFGDMLWWVMKFGDDACRRQGWQLSCALSALDALFCDVPRARRLTLGFNLAALRASRAMWSAQPAT